MDMIGPTALGAMCTTGMSGVVCAAAGTKGLWQVDSKDVEVAIVHGSRGVRFSVPEEKLRAAVGNQAGLEALAHRYLMPAMANLLRDTYPDG